MFPHHKLSKMQAEALTILAEECSELAKECSKILRFGPDFEKDGTTAVHKLETEKHDVLLMLEIVKALGITEEFDHNDYIWRKAVRLDLNSGLGEIAQEVIS